MSIDNWVGWLPLWAVFVVTLTVCIGSAEAGAVLAGIAIRKKQVHEPEAPLSGLVGAMLGLLAFILAFTFGMTGSRFDARKQLVLDEANAIGTTYLRAALLPEKQGLEVRRLLREYAEVRLSVKDGHPHPRGAGQIGRDPRQAVGSNEVGGSGKNGLGTASFVRHLSQRAD